MVEIGKVLFLAARAMKKEIRQQVSASLCFTHLTSLIDILVGNQMIRVICHLQPMASDYH